MAKRTDVRTSDTFTCLLSVSWSVRPAVSTSRSVRSEFLRVDDPEGPVVLQDHRAEAWKLLEVLLGGRRDEDHVEVLAARALGNFRARARPGRRGNPRRACRPLHTFFSGIDAELLDQRLRVLHPLCPRLGLRAELEERDPRPVCKSSQPAFTSTLKGQPENFTVRLAPRERSDGISSREERPPRGYGRRTAASS